MEISKLVEELDSLTPGFSKVWAEWLQEDEEFGDGEPPTEHCVFLEYNDYVIPQLDNLADEKIARLFDYIENSLNSNDSNLAEASKSHCKAWDNFNAEKTKGLW